MILDKIVARKKIQLEEEKSQVSFKEIYKKLETKGTRKASVRFEEALHGRDSISIIAEVKKASPSKGIISHDFNPVKKAKAYQEAGANAVSVLTERHFFMGDDSYLEQIGDCVELPLLRKDFIIDEYQIFQAKSLGADAILLIAAILDEKQIKSFLNSAGDLGLDCLVEVHNLEELKKVLQTGSKIVGINNRNLEDFSVSLDTTARLRKTIPNDKIIVSESGIHNEEDIIFLKNYEIDAVLIGESLMRSPDISEKIQQFKT